MEKLIYFVTACLSWIQARIEDGGKYMCWVNNTAGEETIQVTLTVTGKIESSSMKIRKKKLNLIWNSCISISPAPLTVHLQPQVQIVDVDKDAQFQCIVSGHPVNDVNWLHDGKPIIGDNRIEVSENQKSHPFIPGQFCGAAENSNGNLIDAVSDIQWST